MARYRKIIKNLKVFVGWGRFRFPLPPFKQKNPFNYLYPFSSFSVQKFFGRTDIFRKSFLFGSWSIIYTHVHPILIISQISSTSMATIRYWFNEFKRGRTFVFDEERPDRPIEVTTEDMVKKIHDIVLADRRVKSREIAGIVDISTECYTKNWAWESYRRDGIAWQLRSTVWTCLSAIPKSLYCVSWLLTKHGSITTRLKWKNSQNSGLHPANMLQRTRNRFHRPERS